MTTNDNRPAERAARDKALVQVLQRVWTYQTSTKCDDARTFADEIAEGASRGFLTTSIVPGGMMFGRLWKLTAEGAVFLFMYSNLLAEEEVRYAEQYCAR